MNIIGQEVLCSDIKHMLDDFPLFTIIAGVKGSGKKTIAQWIGEQLPGTHTVVGITVADIRNIIEISHKLSEPMTYIIQDADVMSAEAKGALLKITEEPPKKARFIMTLQNVNSMPDTIISRATVLYMNPYSVKDIDAYIDSKYSGLIDTRIYDICYVPGDVDLFMKDASIYDYVETVVENIADVSTANALKIGDKLALKVEKDKKDKNAEEDKYDLALFWKIFISLCLIYAKESEDRNDMMYYAEGAYITNKYLSNLSIKGANKQMLFTNWILAIREGWQ